MRLSARQAPSSSLSLRGGSAALGGRLTNGNVVTPLAKVHEQSLRIFRPVSTLDRMAKPGDFNRPVGQAIMAAVPNRDLDDVTSTV